MPQNRFYVDAPLDHHTRLTITDEQHHYFRKVLRGKIGDEIEVINGKGTLAQAQVDTLEKHYFCAHVISAQHAPAPLVSLTLAIGLLKPNHLEYAIEKACELGASRFVLFAAANSEKKTISPTYLQRLLNIVEAATKQCGRLYLPQIIVKQHMLECLPFGSHRYFGDFSDSAHPVLTLNLAGQSDIIVFIGPESGFAPSEVKELFAHGCTPVSLHHNTLRAETAVAAATLLFSQRIEQSSLTT